jgi:hypothetical protein
MTPEYCEAVQSLWAGRKTTIICEPTNKLLSVVQMKARKLSHIVCPHQGAYAQIATLEKAALHGAPDIVLLSIGVTATCLAHRLACRGVQALDLGSIGGMLAHLLPLGDRLPPLYPVVVSHPGCADAAAVQRRMEAGGFVVHYGAEKG